MRRPIRLRLALVTCAWLLAACGSEKETPPPAGPGPASVLALSGVPTTSTAGDVVAVTVTARDAQGNVATGYRGTLHATSSDPIAQLPADLAFAASDAGSRTFTVEWRTSGEMSLTLTDLAEASLTVTATHSVAPAAPDASASAVGALPASLAAGGTSTLTAIVRDVFGNPIPGVSVTFEATGTGNTLSQPLVATDPTGVASGSLLSTGAGDKTVTARAGALALAARPVVTFHAGPVDGSRSTAIAAPASLAGDGVAAATVTVTLLDAWDNPVPGQWVTLYSSRGTADQLSSSWETTDVAGAVSFTVRSSLAGTPTFTAVVQAGPVPISLAASVTFVPGPVDPARSTVTASPTSIAADGTSGAAVTVTLRDATGNPVPGKEVALASDRDTDDVIRRVSATTTGADGSVAFTVTSTKFGTATLTATDTTDALTLSQVAQIAFTGTVSPSRSTLTASAAEVLADGSASSTLTVRVVDAFGNPVAGEPVALSSDRQPLDAITPATATTDAGGLATFSVTSRSFGTSTLSATVTGYGLTLAQTATVVFRSYLVFAQPPSDVTAGAPFVPPVAVAARDAEGNTDAAFASDVTLALGAAPAGATLRGTLTASPTAGVATFEDLTLEKAGSGYTLVASTTAPGIPSVTSGAFVVKAGGPASLAFAVQPSVAGAGIGAPILVALLDPFGNTSSVSGLEVTVALGANPTGAVLGGTLTATSLQGVATFEGLTVSLPGSGYTLVASDPLGALSPVTSQPFDVKAVSWIGDGSAASCTEAVLDAALAAGGHHHFACGPDPVTITLTGTKSIAKDVGLDGVGLVTLSGAGARQLFSIPAGRAVAFEHLTLTGGAAPNGGAVYSAGTLSLVGCTLSGSYAAVSNAWGGGSGGNGGAVYNDGGTLLVSGTTFSGNWTGGEWNYYGTFGNGGAIFAPAGMTIVSGSTFTSNSAGNNWPYGGSAANGGAIHQSGGTLRVTDSTFTSNSAAGSDLRSGTMGSGGAIYSAAEPLLVSRCTFASNAAHGQYPYGGTFGAGGAIHVAGGSATLLASTFKGNVSTSNYAYSCAAGNGGAVFVGGGILVAANSTFSGNGAGGSYPYAATTGNGGAIFNAGGRVGLVNVTLADNTAGAGGCYSSTCGLGTALYGPGTLANTLLRGAGACSGTFVDGGHNLDSSGSCGVGPATDPLLVTAGLASNGGPTQTIALQDGSPAIGAGDGALCAAAPVLGVDQRGYARPGSGQGVCSIGALEYGAGP